MIYIKYRVRPRPLSAKFAKYGGAFIGCWIRTNSRKVAQERAAKRLTADDWLIENVIEVRVLRSVPTKEMQLSVDQAKAEGQAYLTFTWPARPQREDKVH